MFQRAILKSWEGPGDEVTLQTPWINFVLSIGWDKTVHEHLKALASNPVETLWPRDTLFKYV